MRSEIIMNIRGLGYRKHNNILLCHSLGVYKILVITPVLAELDLFVLKMLIFQLCLMQKAHLDAAPQYFYSQCLSNKKTPEYRCDSVVGFSISCSVQCLFVF